jgi:predicted DNA-binding transcriptional regulator AlpA
VGDKNIPLQNALHVAGRFFSFYLWSFTMSVEKDNVQFLTAEQCAQRYAISLRHFYTLIERGEMPKPLKLGSCSRWSIRSLEEFESNKKIKIPQKNSFDPAQLLRCKKRKRYLS